MAMLAETRRRKGYTLVPKGKALYEDGDRFGTKMLEKMGWTKGKGLGANEDGEKDFVRIRYKLDSEGFGFEAKDDQWTQHEKDFTGLLKNLHGKDDEAGAVEENTSSLGFGFQADKPTDSMKEKLTGKSLVEMSKTSRARVHYQKFARGKDLSRASEKDLANIFGRKITTEADNIFSSFQAVNVPEEKVEEEPKEEKEGVQIVNTGISISDYFKQKMEALKLKRSATGSGDEVPVKKAKSEDSEVPESIEKPKKKKKKDKGKDVDSDERSAASNSDEVCADKPKKKKDKIKESGTSNCDELISAKLESSEKPKKKKKKDKAIDSEDGSAASNNEEVRVKTSQSEEIPPESTDKAKRKKKKDKINDELLVKFEEESESSEKSKKKKKKSEMTEEVEVREEKSKKKKKVFEQEDPVEEEPKKKKKKKSEFDSETKPSTTDDEPSSQVPSNNPQPAALEGEVEAEGEWQEVKSKRKNKVDLIPEPEEEFEEYDPKKYRINGFVAEKFRNIDMPAFLGSNLSQFKGYGLDEVDKLEVYTRDIDDFKIKEFWKSKLINFDDAEARDEYLKIGSHARSANSLLSLSSYRRKVDVARKEKKKVPKLDLGPIKKRRAFTGI